MDKYNYGTVNVDYCATASDAIQSAFTWTSTPEGMDFWMAVNRRLEKLANGYKPQEKCYLTGGDAASMLNREVERLRAFLELRDKEITSLSAKLVEANRKLMISDWVNHSLPRGAP